MATSAATPRPTSLLGRVAGWCFDHRIKAIGLWLVAFVAIFGAAGAVGSQFSGNAQVPGSGSAAGFAVLAEHFPELGTGGQTGTIVFRAAQGIDDPEVRAAMEDLFATVDAGFPDDGGEPQHPGATVVSPYAERGQSQIARDGPLAGRVAYAQVNLSSDVDDTESGRLGKAISEHAPAIEGLEVFAGGQYLAVIEPPQTELLGLAFAMIVLILAFGSVLAMGLPIAVALGGVAAGMGMTLLLSNVFTIPNDATVLGIMIGLGVGIDYALFIVSRYREGLHAGRSARASTVIAMESAGRAVIFAGTTVMISMLGLLLVGVGSVGGMGIGVSATVLATMFTSTTLLPALLGFARERVELTRWRGLIAAGFTSVALLGLGIGFAPLATFGGAFALLTLLASLAVRPLLRAVPRRVTKPMEATLAYRWSRTIQRNPLRWLVGATVVLVLLAAPVASLRLGWADDGNFPEGTDTRQAYDLLAEGFGDGFNGPFLITVVGESADAVAALHAALVRTNGVAAVTAPIANDPAQPGAYLMSLVATTAPQDEATAALVRHLRADVIPAATAGTGLDVEVTGGAAIAIDITDYLAKRMLLFFGAVLALSFVLLLIVFRSLLVPLKAVLMNVLTIGAAYGIVVAVFQWGWAGGLIGIEGGPINPFIPMMLFAVVFGLSMDYEVLLLSRIREEYLRTGDANTSVADGVASTARVITAAAAIMVVVFASFTLEDMRELKIFGLGLAVAVFLDATLVRLVVVPATMELLGDRNWWIPKWFDRILPHLEIEPTQPAVPAGDRHGHERTDAIEWLATRAGMIPDRPLPPIQPKRVPTVGSAAAVMDPVVERYVRACESVMRGPQGAPVRNWLHARGIDDDIIRVNRVGADPGRTLMRRHRGLPFGAGIAATLPALDPAGNVTYVQARYLDPTASGRKYDNPAAALAPNPRTAFAARTGPERDGVLLVCEGIPDALIAAQAGYPAVALLGANAPDEAVAMRIANHAVNCELDVVLVCDPDPAGRHVADTLTNLLAREGIVPAVVIPPDGCDLNAWALAFPGWADTLDRTLRPATVVGRRHDVGPEIDM